MHLSETPGVVNGVGTGQTATFDVTFTGDGRPHRFDLQFVRQGTDVVLGSIPVVLGTPIVGDGYEYGELEDGEIDDTVNFGNQIDPAAAPNVAPSFVKGTDILVLQDSGSQTIPNWGTNIIPGPPSEASQVVDFIVTNDTNALFSVQPSISPDGTLSFTPTAGAFGTATVTVQLHDDAGTVNGGVDTSATDVHHHDPGHRATINHKQLPVRDASGRGDRFQRGCRRQLVGIVSADRELDNGLPVTPQSFSYDSLLHRATATFNPAVMSNANYRLTIPAGTLPGQSSLHQFDFFILAGDANRDGKVDVTDLGVLATNWQQSPRTFSRGDFNYDGAVDVSDLGILATNWQMTLGAPAQAAGAAAPLSRPPSRGFVHPSVQPNF